jgi:cell division initiation protein
MTLTPVELRHVQLPRGLVGYRRGAVEQALEDAIKSFEDVWRDRADLRDRVEQLEADLERYRELETLLRATLVSAEQAAHELKDAARREAEVVISEAHAEARKIKSNAAAERERLTAESQRIRALLAGALQTVDESVAPERTRAAA